MATAHLGGSVSLSISVEQIEVTRGPGYDPDPDWEYTDPEGHVHAWANPATWVYVQDEPDWQDEDGEEYPGDGHHECVVCGAHIEPGLIATRGDMYRKFVPGQRHATLTLEDGTRVEITEQECDEITAAIRAGNGQQVAAQVAARHTKETTG